MQCMYGVCRQHAGTQTSEAPAPEARVGGGGAWSTTHSSTCLSLIPTLYNPPVSYNKHAFMLSKYLMTAAEKA